MIKLKLIQRIEFERIKNEITDPDIKLKMIADMARANTIMAIKKAGSGHLGSSFSAMDIVTFLFYEKMDTIELGFENPNRDIYFSSKGHDVPGLYSILHSLGVIGTEKLLKLFNFIGPINIQSFLTNKKCFGVRLKF